MELEIRIGLDGAAFEDYGVEEVSRILESVAGRIPDPLRTTSGGALSCHDANGNHCGTAEIIDDREALILSAAPNLLAACKAARSVAAHMGWNLGPAGKAIEDAISKAGGGGR